MRSPFPGMDPYLERPGLWEEVHTSLIGGIQGFLTPLLQPTYRVAVEQRTYLSVLLPGDQFVGKPDVLFHGEGGLPPASSASGGTMVMEAVQVEPLLGRLPQVEEVKERYLEIRQVDTQEVVTVIEILSMSNKRAGQGRKQYEDKRTKVLGSLTNLIEIDLLRGGKALPMDAPHPSDYHIVVSRSRKRPSADFYLFNLPQAIPNFLVPLRPGEAEPSVPLNQILHDLYEQSGYDLAINYQHTPPPPTLSDEVQAWMADLLENVAD